MTKNRYGLTFTQVNRTNAWTAPSPKGEVLMSYETLVGLKTPTHTYITSTKWSVTTTRHIHKWMSIPYSEVEQVSLERMILS